MVQFSQGCGHPAAPVAALRGFDIAGPGERHRAAPDRPAVSARLAGELSSPAGKRQFRRGVLDATSGTVAEVGSAGSHLIAALARADCLIDVPVDVTSVADGSVVTVRLLDC